MAKSKHESFSSIDRSNFQLLKAKLRENGLKKHLGKGEENEKHGKSKQKEKGKKRSWWKWLSSVRGHWTCQGTRSSHKKSEMIVKNTLKVGDDVRVNSNSIKTDITEIPVELGEKISEILIKPIKTGIKATIAHYRGFSAYSERPARDQVSVPNDFSYEIKSLDKDGEKVKKKNKKTNRKRLIWNTEVFESNTDIAKNNESLLTSALFIHQDMDKIVESAVFIEPHLPKDYIESNKFDEISQKSLRVNKTGGSYKIFDEKSDQILKTFKTVSEPTWDERKKILRQQRLQDNINNLLEQFLLLEVENVISLPLHQNKLMESQKKIEFNQNSRLNSREPLVKKLSRKVSPEILVNIKPFKEYVSDDYIGIEKSSTELIFENHVFRSKDHIMRKKTTEVVEKSKVIVKNEKISEENIFPVLKCAVKSAKESDVGERVLFLSNRKKTIKKTCYENCAEQIFGFVSAQPDKDAEPVTPCEVWGLYRSYSTRANLVDEKGGEQEKKMQRSKNSLDEVLDNLDDSDHDVIFQKNISQFRRKINVIPRLDVKKPVTYSGKMEAAKIKPKNVRKSAKFAEPCENDFGKTKAASLRRGKKVGAFRFDCLDLWKHQQKQEKILENIFLQLSETKMIIRPRVEATRIEARTINFPRTLRIVHDILESNNFAIMEIEMPMRFEKNLNMELLWVGSRETLQWSDRSSVDVKNYITVAVVLSFQGQDFDGKFCTTEYDVGKLGKHILQSSKFFPDGSECFYLIQNQLLIDCAQKSRSSLSTLSVSETFGSSCLENSKKIESDKKDLTSVTAGEKHILKLYEPLYNTYFGSAKILCTSFYEYVACMYDWVFISRDTSSKSQPEPNVLENNLYSGHSAPSLSNLKNSIPTQKEIPSSKFVNQLKKETVDIVNCDKSNSDFRFDGFQILYNNSKESLDDEEESIKVVFAKHLLEKNSKSAFPSRTNTFAKGLELLDDHEEKEEEEGYSQKKKNIHSNEEMNILRNFEKKNSETLKYKSESSPRETIHQTEFCCHEHRMRSLILSTEKEFHDCKKRRLSLNKDMEVRKTESAISESRTSAIVRERSCVEKKSSFGMRDTVKSVVLPCELKNSAESKPKSGGKKKRFVLEKSGMNVGKEVVAAFNSIEEFNRSKGETKGGHKRMSVVIMLSRK